MFGDAYDDDGKGDNDDGVDMCGASDEAADVFLSDCRISRSASVKVTFFFFLWDPAADADSDDA